MKKLTGIITVTLVVITIMITQQSVAAISISVQEYAPRKIFFHLTIDLPGKVVNSFCKGDFLVKCGDVILAEGSIDLKDLSRPENRVFEYEIDLSGFQLSEDQILWRFRGEVYDAKLDKEYGPMVMQGENLDETLEGIGYDITINQDGNIHTQKHVYRRQIDADKKKPPVLHNLFPPLTGPFSVGVRSYFWIDQEREEIFTKDPNDRRHLLVQVWYPARVEPDMDTAPYIQNPEAYGPSAQSSRIIHIKTNSVDKAPLSDESLKYPVLLFSHGMHANRFCSTFLMEYLASHGYIIFSIGHTFFNGVEVFPDGYHPKQDFFPKMEEAQFQDEGYRKFSDFLQQYTFDPLSQDTQFVLHKIEQLNKESVGFFQDRLDLDRMGIFGWSIGGVNAAQMCNRLEQLKAGINFDGTFNGIIAQDGVEKPFMIMKSDPPIPENPDEEFKKMLTMIKKYESEFISHSEHVFRIIISGSRHTNFSDQPLYDTDAAGSVNTKRCHEIIMKLTKAFFDRYILGRKDIDLNKLAETYPEILIEEF